MARKTETHTAGLESVQRRFERWRRTRRSHSRIPASLWASAVKVAGTCGVCRTARALRLDYYTLKRRVEEKAAESPAVAAQGMVATFLELAPPVSAASGECAVELENAGGTKLRIWLKGIEAPDVATLGRSLWSCQP